MCSPPGSRRRRLIESLDGRLRWLEATEATVENWPDTGIDDDRRDAARRESHQLLVHVEQQLAACRRTSTDSADDAHRQG